LVHNGHIPRFESPHCSTTFNVLKALNFLTGDITLTSASDIVEEAVKIVKRLVEEDARHIDGCGRR